MNTNTFQLNDIEQACDVTLEAVEATLKRAAIFDGKVLVPDDVPPALAQATARCMLDSEHITYLGMNYFNHAVYTKGE